MSKPKMTKEHFLCRIQKAVLGAVGKGICHQTLGPEFDSLNPHEERKELTPLSCLLTSIHALEHA